MATISIWGRHHGRTEKIDSASSQSSAEYLAGEYRLAIGREWTIWTGRRDAQEIEDRNRRDNTRRNWEALGVRNY